MTLILHSVSYAAGFWFVCYQKRIDASKIVTALLAGFALGVLTLLGLKLSLGIKLTSHLPLLPFYSLLGATAMLWVQAHEDLTAQTNREGLYALTLSFLYFLTPWTGNYVTIGYVGAIPAAIAIFLCWRPQSFSKTAQNLLMLWMLLASVAIGVQQILIAPENMLPSADFATGKTLVPLIFFNTFLKAGGFVALALNVFPLLDWLRGNSVVREGAINDHPLDEAVPLKAMMIFTAAQGLPLLLNWKFGIFGYGPMLDFSFAYGPVFAAHLAKSLCERHVDTGFHFADTGVRRDQAS